MRKLFIISLILFFYTTNINSQTLFGVKAGINISNLYGDNTENFSVRTSVHFGALAEFKLSEKFSIQPEIIYSAQGVKESVDSYFAHWHLNYLYLPVMSKYYINKELSIEIGPQIGYLANAKLDWEDNNEAGLDDLDHLTSSVDFGVNFGLSYNLVNGINFGARYNLGISNVLEENEEGFILKNGVFQFSIGYSFN